MEGEWWVVCNLIVPLARQSTCGTFLLLLGKNKGKLISEIINYWCESSALQTELGGLLIQLILASR